VTTPTWSTLSIDTSLALRTAASRLTDEFTGTFGTETIERFLHTSYDQLAQHAAVTKFLPLMAERFARQRLRAVAKVEGLHLDGNRGWPVMMPSPGRADPNPDTRSTPPQSPHWPNEASTSPVSSPNHGPTKRSAPPMS
jgi:hypothetical protein